MTTAPDRSRFLHPPPDLTAPEPDDISLQLLATAQDLLQETFYTSPHWYRELLGLEAHCSAAIEGEYDQARIDAHHQALLSFVPQPPGHDSLLKLHRRMMTGQPHAQPGTYRTVNVTVGRHRPPPHPMVPSMMAGLFDYLGRTQDVPLLKAAWGHLQFETIHPFADGNGRTGRALINQVLKAPIPLSVYILDNRQAYYRLLDSGDWPEYLNWFLGGVTQQCQAVHKHREEYPPWTDPTSPT